MDRAPDINSTPAADHTLGSVRHAQHWAATIKGGTNPRDYPAPRILGLAIPCHARQLGEHPVHRAPLMARGCPRPGGWQGAQPVLRPRAPASYKGLLSSLGSASVVTCPSWGQGGDVPAASSCVQGQGTLWPVLHHAPGMGMRVVYHRCLAAAKNCWPKSPFLASATTFPTQETSGGLQPVPVLHRGRTRHFPTFLTAKSQGESDAELELAASSPQRGVGVNQKELTHRPALCKSHFPGCSAIPAPGFRIEGHAALLGTLGRREAQGKGQIALIFSSLWVAEALR